MSVKFNPFSGGLEIEQDVTYEGLPDKPLVVQDSPPADTDALWVDITETVNYYDNAEIKARYESNDDTNAFTNAEKSKLTDIAEGAEVNVNADWAATDGDAEILNKPTLGTAAATAATDYATAAQGTKADTAVQPAELTPYAPLNNPTFTGTSLILPNNSRINGTEHFYQTTKPTARGDSSALVVGDRWWKTDTGEEWSWNGTYWLGEPITIGAGGYIAGTGSITCTNDAALHSDYFLRSFSYQFNNLGVLNAVDKWLFTVVGLRSDGAVGIGYAGLTNISLESTTTVTGPRITIDVNVLASSDYGNNVKGFRINFTRFASAGALFLNAHALYYRIAP
jgi:hypothetical protein